MIMNQQTSVLTQRIEQLTKSYQEQHAGVNVSMQSYFMEQYQEIITALEHLGNKPVKGHNAAALTYLNLHSAAGLLGMYLMV